MKILIFILLLSLGLFAEMGDCFKCHPSLKNDGVHGGMSSCIKCHSKSKSDATECGDKCFSCHTKDDMDVENIYEHEVFEDCRECHVTKIHNIFDTSTSFDQSHPETLQDFLKP